MKAIQFIQVTPEYLTEVITEGVKKEIASFFKEREKEDVLLTREETAQLLKINLSTLHEWTKKEKLIPYGIGNRVYYKKDEVLSSLKKI